MSGLRLPRRRFLLSLAGAVPLPFIARRFHRLAVASLDPVRLRALGAAVLPTELGTTGRERVIAGFERWLAGYREGVELVHGYGTAEIRRTGPSPALRWANQLDALGPRFAELGLDERQTALRAALETPGARFAGLPQVDRAPHLALGLLAFYFTSSEANDLCYELKIGRNNCRPLADAPARPLPLAPGS